MSKIEVNQISSQCGSTLTIGQSGDTVTLACGATQTGFGRTGTVDWCTTAKTAPFTGVSGKGYFVNTTCGAITFTLPATPTAGDIISIKDYGGTFQTNNLTLCNNGSKINAVCNPSLLNTQNQSVTLIYVDATKGWQDIQDSTAGISGGYIYNVEYLIVAGGGGGAGPNCYGGGGGGAGGFRTAACFAVSSASGSYTVTVGAGGNGVGPGATTITKGSDSVFSSITSAGGGGGSRFRYYWSSW
jgi:mucin-19